MCSPNSNFKYLHPRCFRVRLLGFVQTKPLFFGITLPGPHHASERSGVLGSVRDPVRILPNPAVLAVWLWLREPRLSGREISQRPRRNFHCDLEKTQTPQHTQHLLGLAAGFLCSPLALCRSSELLDKLGQSLRSFCCCVSGQCGVNVRHGRRLHVLFGNLQLAAFFPSRTFFARTPQRLMWVLGCTHARRSLLSRPAVRSQPPVSGGDGFNRESQQAE